MQSESNGCLTTITVEALKKTGLICHVLISGDPNIKYLWKFPIKNLENPESKLKFVAYSNKAFQQDSRHETDMRKLKAYTCDDIGRCPWRPR